MFEGDILFNAAENLKKWIQLPIDIGKSDDRNIDAVLRIGSGREYHVEIKKEVHKSNLSNILRQFSQLITGLPLLVAMSISKPARDVLSKENINYLDMAGNCFIRNKEGLYIQIEGKKLIGIDGKKKHSAFNKNGVKLIYALLLNEDLINQSYSVIAKASNISKSTIGSILKDLKEKNFLIQVNSKIRKLTNKKELQEKWVYSYNEKLKPSLFRGKFSFLPKKYEEWKTMNLGEDTFWGGEPAADILTNHLSPGEWTIYSNRTKSNLLNNLYLVPKPEDGKVTIYNTFWNLEEPWFANGDQQIINPLLVYADLIGTEDNRNFETANMIYEREL